MPLTESKVDDIIDKVMNECKDYYEWIFR
jgi:hypothetical protein